MNRTRILAGALALAGIALSQTLVAASPSPAPQDALGEMKSRFNAASGTVRIVTLLAPT